jgi:glyoxylate reductase
VVRRKVSISLLFCDFRHARKEIWLSFLCLSYPACKLSTAILGISVLTLSGAGYDSADPEACSKRDPPLLISNVPAVTDDATADTAMFLLLGTIRNFNISMYSLRQGDWRGKPLPAFGHDPQGKVLGILGMGGIGRNIKKKAAAFGMTTIYHNRKKLDPELADGAEYVSFEELLKRSDVLSLNLPSNPKTRHIISMDQFNLMKPSCVIINTAR